MPGVICAICYEDAQAGRQDLQSVSGCGHVFHELCLQQWFEYCPHNRQPTCPVCKQTCSRKDVHRLFFLSMDELSQANSPSQSSKILLADGQSFETCQAELIKLEGQLKVANSALQIHKEQLLELDNKLANCKMLLEKSETARHCAMKETERFQLALIKAQQDLKNVVIERDKLAEKNVVLTQDLASIKLITDVNIDEHEAVKLAQIQGRCASNKNEVINTLSKSLVLRNKTYKELMTKCSELGMSESCAVRKLAKATEQIKQLKVHIQGLERSLDNKANAEIRSKTVLKKKPYQTPDQAQNKLLPGRSSAGIAAETSFLSSDQCFHNHSHFILGNENISGGGDKNYSTKPQGRENDAGITFLNEQEDRGIRIQLKRLHEQSHIEENKGPMCVSGSGSPESNDDCIILDSSKHTRCPNIPRETRQDASSGFGLSFSIRREVGISQKQSYNGPSIIAGDAHPEKDVQMYGKVFGRPQKYSNCDSNGSFILSGPNGRGGRVKVLKPPAPLGIGNTVCKPAKRCKTMPNAGNRNGALQIEHFFGPGRGI